jgi:alkanesulfonate monooxygenase SsuD/methylene tetrahydromethanopterin reductase-like flavin-dependent oxidoreductase (luciferase family)
MRYAFDLANFGPYADPRTLAGLAHEAEDSGWDGFFIWDHVQVSWPDPVGDPTVALAAIAMATKSIRFGPMVIPLPRRHPWKVAREAATLDHLSGGRLTLGIGLGSDALTELTTLGIPTDDRVRAEMLDEGLAVLTGLLSGEQFSFLGKHYTVKATQFLPRPVQPHIPIWMAGTWPRPRPFRRAARYDGVVPITANIEEQRTPEMTQAVTAFIAKHRNNDAPFDVIHSGITPGKSRAEDAAIVEAFAAAGATWWFESPLPWRTTIDEVRARIRFGPPPT